jgi:hypothetical protein
LQIALMFHVPLVEVTMRASCLSKRSTAGKH